MPSVCFYFQVHQPFRVKRYSFFDSITHSNFFDEKKNSEVIKKVAKKCYLPANQKMLDLIERFDGKFRISYSITGVAIEQMKLYAPEVLESFKKLAKTGCVEFLGETYFHSLAALYDHEEFVTQVKMHTELIQNEFGLSPAVFRDTELIYQDFIGNWAQDLGFKAVIAEGADDILDWRSPNYVYQVPKQAGSQESIRLLLKNYRLSDDIAFRFSNQSWQDFPLTAEKFAGWVHSLSGSGDTVNLFMDYETFGEHQWASTGIFDFIEHMPQQILADSDWDFKTPSEVIASYSPVSDLSFQRLTSWADVERDISAWQGNSIQKSSLKEAFRVGTKIKEAGNSDLLQEWRKLLTSDHFYYMSTKWFADGDVHAYFSPYESPYEAFINYRNALKNLAGRLDKKSIMKSTVSTPLTPVRLLAANA